MGSTKDPNILLELELLCLAIDSIIITSTADENSHESHSLCQSRERCKIHFTAPFISQNGHCTLSLQYCMPVYIGMKYFSRVLYLHLQQSLHLFTCCLCTYKGKNEAALFRSYGEAVASIDQMVHLPCLYELVTMLPTFGSGSSGVTASFSTLLVQTHLLIARVRLVTIQTLIIWYFTIKHLFRLVLPINTQTVLPDRGILGH